jgi:hypothetical protein
MATAVAGPASPLLAFGPPGWLAFAAIVGVATAGTVYLVNAGADRTFTPSRTVADTRTCNKCPEQHRGRFQAQGGGLEKSSAWGQGTPPTVAQGLTMVSTLYASLSRTEQRDRATAYAQITRWISKRPPGGVYAEYKDSWPKPALPGGIRIDIEVLAGYAFLA